MNNNFKKLENELLIDLKINNKKGIIDKISKNCKFIQFHFHPDLNGDLKTIEKFVFTLNNIILSTNHKYHLIEKVLKHEAFNFVLKVFQNSNVLIRACKERNVSAVKWLLTMKINYRVQDEFGKTALMYAVEDSKLLFAVKQLVLDKDNLNMLDFNNENALFHATKNKSAFKIILDSNIKLNQLNINHESILVYCCKYKHYKLIKYLVKKENINVDIEDNEEKTAIMYLAEDGRYSEIRTLSLRNCNVNYMNMYYETALSLLLKNLYKVENVSQCSQYYHTMIELINLGCDFNVPVDEDGNTAIMVFIMVHDHHSLNYTLRFCKDLDLTIKNCYGDDASSFFFNFPKNNHCKFVIEYSDKSFVDIDNSSDNIRMLILSSLFQPKKNKITYNNEEEEIQDYYYFNSNINNNYSDFKMMDVLAPEAAKIYKKNIKRMIKKDYSDHFSSIFILGRINGINTYIY
jgi:hypothetical protein